MYGGRWSFVSGQRSLLECSEGKYKKYYWTGRITTTAGTVYEFDQDDMVKGSGYGIFMDGGDGYWYGFANQGNSSGSATVLWI